MNDIRIYQHISPPNFHKLYVKLIHTFWYVNMPNVTAGYARFSVLMSFFRELSYIIISLKHYNFVNLLQIVC